MMMCAAIIIPDTLSAAVKLSYRRVLLASYQGRGGDRPTP